MVTSYDLYSVNIKMQSLQLTNPAYRHELLHAKINGPSLHNTVPLPVNYIMPPGGAAPSKSGLACSNTEIMHQPYCVDFPMKFSHHSTQF